MNAPHSPTCLAQVLEASTGEGPLRLDGSWRGFAGIQGGLALGLLVNAMQARAPGRVLRQVSGRFCRPLREPFRLKVSVLQEGRTVSWLEASALEEEERLTLAASAVFAGPEERRKGREAAPSMPDVPPPSACPVFKPPTEFVPFTQHVEIRPVGPELPCSGGAEPVLMAWLRVVDDDAPPDPVRLMVLMDSLAPSYSVVLTRLIPIPTVTFTVTPGSGLASADSPWILLRAHTDLCLSDGWLLERLDAWAPNGAHLGSAEQLRVLAAG